jgi:DNA polymerase
VPAFHPAAALYDRSKVDAVESDLETAFDAA